MEIHRTKRDLENGFPALKRVTAKGKKYVYVQDTGVVIVRGFTGSDEALEALIARNIGPALARRRRTEGSLISGWREDAAKARRSFGDYRSDKQRASDNGISAGNEGS